MIITFLIVLTMNILSGIIFPISNMPQAVQYLTYLMPIRYFAIIVRGILLRGIGIEILWPQALALVLLGVLTLTLSISRLRKKCSKIRLSFFSGIILLPQSPLPSHTYNTYRP